MRVDTPELNTLPLEIRASDAGSFAEYTFIRRFPHIVDQIIKDNALDLKVQQNLRKIKFDFNKGSIELHILDYANDSPLWGKVIKLYAGKKWIDIPFFIAEMYFYRRILEVINYFDKTSSPPLDPYAKQKYNH